MNTKLKYYFSLIKGQCGYKSAATLFGFDFTHNRVFSFLVVGIATGPHESSLNTVPLS